MYCPKCGNKLDDGSKRCNRCGTSFEERVADAEGVQPAPVYEEPPKRAHRGWLPRAIASFGCGILLGLVLVFVVMPRLSGSSALAIDESTFPDEALRTQIAKAADLDADGSLSQAELGALKSFRVVEARRVSGLEMFSALEELTVAGDQLEELELHDMPALTHVIAEEAPSLSTASFENCVNLQVVDFTETERPVVTFDETTNPGVVRVPDEATVTGVDDTAIERMPSDDVVITSSSDEDTSVDAVTYPVITDTTFETEYYVVTMPDEWTGDWSVDESTRYQNAYEFHYHAPNGMGGGGVVVVVTPTDEAPTGTYTAPELVGKTDDGSCVWTADGAGFQFFSEGRAQITVTSTTQAPQENSEEVVHFTGADFLLPEAWWGKVAPEIGQTAGADERILWDGAILMGWDPHGAERVDEMRGRQANGERFDYADTGTEYLSDGTTLIFGSGNDGVRSVEIIDASGRKGYLWTIANSEFRVGMGTDPDVVAACLQLQAEAAGVSADGDPYEIATAFLRACAERLTLQ